MGGPFEIGGCGVGLLCFALETGSVVLGLGTDSWIGEVWWERDGEIMARSCNACMWLLRKSCMFRREAGHGWHLKRVQQPIGCEYLLLLHKAYTWKKI